ncbi:MAG: alpha/beta hydrolase [Bifidobacteriaceae bacterium]|jgi:acetyl esterase/lipase|nr:alpha/beta hydrolase [Bifidobacteriaceae bacterium]
MDATTMTATLPATAGLAHEAPADRDLAYGPDPMHRLDVYHPPAPNGAMILLIHGGGWWQGDKSKEEGLARRLADAGYLVVAPNYRFATGAATAGGAANPAGAADAATGQTRQNLYPAQVEDVLAALDWAMQSPLNFHKVGAIGGSSGGNLALEVAIARGVPAVSWSGLLDLAGFMERHGDAAPHPAVIDASTPGAAIDQGGPDPGYYKWLLFNLLGPGLEGLDRATPIGRIDPATGPVLMANSMDELVPREEPLIAAKALADAGVPSRVLLFEGARHATGYLEDALPETLRFFGHYLTPVATQT